MLLVQGVYRHPGDWQCFAVAIYHPSLTYHLPWKLRSLIQRSRCLEQDLTLRKVLVIHRLINLGQPSVAATISLCSTWQWECAEVISLYGWALLFCALLYIFSVHIRLFPTRQPNEQSHPSFIEFFNNLYFNTVVEEYISYLTLFIQLPLESLNSFCAGRRNFIFLTGQ